MKFDRASACFLINYSTDESMLMRILQNIYDSLKPGGRFFGLNATRSFTKEDLPFWEKYNIYWSWENEELKEGDRIVTRYKNDEFGLDFKFESFYFHPSTYERCFEKVGFVNFRRVALILDDEYQDKEYFKDLMDHPFTEGLEAYKPNKAQ